MSNEMLENNWLIVKPHINSHIEELLWGLFLDSSMPFFDINKVDRADVAKFIKDEKVKLVTYEFILAMNKHWSLVIAEGEVLNIKSRNAQNHSFEPFKALDISHLEPIDSAKSGATADSSILEPNAQLSSSEKSGGFNHKSPIEEESLAQAAQAAQALTPAPALIPDEVMSDEIADSALTMASQMNSSIDSAGREAPNPSLDLTEQSPSTSATVPDTSSNTVFPGGADLNTDNTEQKPIGNLKPGQIPEKNSNKKAVSGVAPQFHLPNCKVGIYFEGPISGIESGGALISVSDIKMPEGLGLVFEPQTQLVKGTPLLDGEFELNLQWYYSEQINKGKFAGSCKLTSNPDPRSLWKVIEPAQGLAYPKSHLDSKKIDGSLVKIAAASRRGRSHEHSGSYRDDDFFIANDDDAGWSFLIVADGAGGSKSSREGSRIATQVSGDFILDTLRSEFGEKISSMIAMWDTDANIPKTIGTEFHYFYHTMAGDAIQAIEREAKDMNVPPKDYSTTLLAVVAKKLPDSIFISSFWMGDGAIVAYGRDGNSKLMGVPDGGEFAGQTRFLDRNALADQSFGKRIRVGKLPNISALLLMTDGVSDPYFESDSQLNDPVKWDMFWDEISPFLNDDSPDKKLLEWLHFFKPGHHDDRTIAILW